MVVPVLMTSCHGHRPQQYDAGGDYEFRRRPAAWEALLAMLLKSFPAAQGCRCAFSRSSPPWAGFNPLLDRGITVLELEVPTPNAQAALFIPASRAPTPAPRPWSGSPRKIRSLAEVRVVR
jgi:hypothetical protein